MIAKSWLVVGVALLGAVASVFPSDAFAGKKKGSMKCTTDRVGKFTTNASKLADGLGGNYQPGTESFAIAGGSGKVSGVGNKYHALIRALALSGTVADLETRSDFPVTFTSSVASFNEVDTKGIPIVGGGSVTTKSWLGTSEVSITISSYKDLGIKKGKHLALVQGSFSGSIPVLAGDTAPLAMSDGTFSLKVEVQ